MRSHSYMSVEQTLRAKGDVFMERGDKYWEEGKQSHAEGCWKKAEKKYIRANAMEEFRLSRFIGKRRAGV